MPPRKYEEIPCVQCNKPFRPRGAASKYCSRDCAHLGRRAASGSSKCLYCKSPLPATARTRGVRAQPYCNRVCADRGRRRWRVDTPLKTRFVTAIDDRNITASTAATETGVKAATILNWLRERKHRLKVAQLEAVAHWLAISMDDAIRLQGGTAEELQRTAIAEALRSEKMQAYRDRVKNDPEYRRAFQKRTRAQFTGTKHSQAHRDKISAALKEYRQRENAHAIPIPNGTPRHSARTIFGNLQRWHPDWTDEQRKAEAVRRLMQPPHSITDEQKARALLEPKARRKPVVRRAPRRPHRCAILNDLDTELSRLPSGRRQHQFMYEFERRVRSIEGDATPDHTALKVWISEHERRCINHRPRLGNGKAKG